MIGWVFLGDEPFSHHRRGGGLFANMVVEGSRGLRVNVLRRRVEVEGSGLAGGATPWRSPFRRIKNLTIVVPS